MLLSSGQFVWNRSLLSIDALRGTGWSFSLRYLPDNNIDDFIGKNWNFPQNQHLIELTGGDVQLVNANHTRETFQDTGGGSFSSQNNETMSFLTRAGSGASDEFTMTSWDGTVTKFFAFDPAITTPGRLKSITDRFSNEQTYTWTNTAGVDQLLDVTDSYGRVVEYRYFGAPEDHRLREIEDFLGRKLNFQYDSLGHLTAVIVPSVLRAADGNTFPGGEAYVFQYDVNNPRPECRDDLIRIFYPNQTAPFLEIPLCHIPPGGGS